MALPESSNGKRVSVIPAQPQKTWVDKLTRDEASSFHSVIAHSKNNTELEKQLVHVFLSYPAILGDEKLKVVIDNILDNGNRVLGLLQGVIDGTPAPVSPAVHNGMLPAAVSVVPPPVPASPPAGPSLSDLLEKAEPVPIGPVGNTLNITPLRIVQILRLIREQSDGGFNEPKLKEILEALKLDRSIYLLWCERELAIAAAARSGKQTFAFAPKKKEKLQDDDEEEEDEDERGENDDEEKGATEDDCPPFDAPRRPGRRVFGSLVVDEGPPLPSSALADLPEAIDIRRLAKLSPGAQLPEDGLPPQVRARLEELFAVLPQPWVRFSPVTPRCLEAITSIATLLREYSFGWAEVLSRLQVKDSFLGNHLSKNKDKEYLTPSEQKCLAALEAVVASIRDARSENKKPLSSAQRRIIIAALRLLRKGKRPLREFYRTYKLDQPKMQTFADEYAGYTTGELLRHAVGEEEMDSDGGEVPEADPVDAAPTNTIDAEQAVSALGPPAEIGPDGVNVEVRVQLEALFGSLHLSPKIEGKMRARSSPEDRRTIACIAGILREYALWYAELVEKTSMPIPNVSGIVKKFPCLSETEERVLEKLKEHMLTVAPSPGKHIRLTKLDEACAVAAYRLSRKKGENQQDFYKQFRLPQGRIRQLEPLYVGYTTERLVADIFEKEKKNGKSDDEQASDADTPAAGAAAQSDATISGLPAESEADSVPPVVRAEIGMLSAGSMEKAVPADAPQQDDPPVATDSADDVTLPIVLPSFLPLEESAQPGSDGLPVAVRGELERLFALLPASLPHSVKDMDAKHQAMIGTIILLLREYNLGNAELIARTKLPSAAFGHILSRRASRTLSDDEKRAWLKVREEVCALSGNISHPAHRRLVAAALRFARKDIQRIRHMCIEWKIPKDQTEIIDCEYAAYTTAELLAGFLKEEAE